MILLLAFFRSSRNDGTAYAFIGAAAGVYVFYRGLKLLQRKRLILNTPASKIRSAAMGLVEINGLAAGPYTMPAPITGVPCYYFHTTAWQLQKRGKSNQWVKVADESLHVPFFLDDNTARVLVDPQGAEMEIHRDYHDEFSTSLFSSGLEIPSNVSSFLARNGVSTDKTIKIDEYCIKPKNALFIMGTLAQNHGLSVSPNPVRNLNSEQGSISLRWPGVSGRTSFRTAESGGQTESAANRLQETSKAGQASDPAQEQKIRAALMKAGITNPAAWAAAGLATAVSAVPVSTSTGGGAAAAPAPEPFDPHPPVVMMKGQHDPAFFISWRSQREVVKSLNWKSTLMIWGGPALTLACTYILAIHFNWL